MVTYESSVSSGWFYWNFKMEGGAFAEWDYLRGVKEGWIPTIAPGETALGRFGECESLIFKATDSMSFTHPYPAPDASKPDWQDVTADDDVVRTHGESLLVNTRGEDDDDDAAAREWKEIKDKGEWGGLFAVFLLVYCVWRSCFRRKAAYQRIAEGGEGGGGGGGGERAEIRV